MNKIDNLSSLFVGHQGEENARVINIDVSEWVNEYPQPLISLVLHRPGEEDNPYFAITTVENGVLKWQVSRSDCAIAGEGRGELRADWEDGTAKSYVFKTLITECLPGTAEPTPPPAAEEWVHLISLEAKEIIDAKAEVFSKEDGHLIVYTVAGDRKDLGQVDGINGTDGKDGKDGIDGKDGAPGPQGEKGEKGDKGNKGDKGDKGEQGIQGEKGEKGDKGDDGVAGQDGIDGFSPTIEVKESTSDSYVLTITNENGSYDTPNLHGAKGDNGQDGKGIYTIPYYTGNNTCTEAEFKNIAQKVINGEVVATEKITDPNNSQWDYNLRAFSVTYSSGQTPSIDTVVNIMFSAVVQPNVAASVTYPSIYVFTSVLNKNNKVFRTPVRQALLKSTDYITAGLSSGETAGNRATIEGQNNIGSGARSHTGGTGCNVSGLQGFGHGTSIIIPGYAGVGFGGYCNVLQDYGFSAGLWARSAAKYQTVIGRYNQLDTIDESGIGNYMFILGNGTGQSAMRNIFTVGNDGDVSAKSFAPTGADYAEFFEWADGNPDNEDRIGRIVTLDGDKIRLANYGDDILGIISGTVGVLGDNYENEWHKRYLTDDYGRLIYEEYEAVDVIVDEDGNEVEKRFIDIRPKTNPDYNPETPYIPRKNRKEWSPVGMLGKLYVTDDGTCDVGGYATVDEDGIATASTEKTNMRVLERTKNNIIRVLLK